MKSNLQIIEKILEGEICFECPESVNINGVILVFTNVRITDETGYYGFYNKDRLSATIHKDTIIKYYNDSLKRGY